VGYAPRLVSPATLMPQRRRLLFITDVCPYPLDRGQRVRVHNLLEACAGACEVTFVGPVPDAEPGRAALDRLVARTVCVSGAGADGGGWRDEPFARALRAVRVADHDLVWAERLHVARLCRRGAVRARTIVDLDDLEHVKIGRRLRLDPLRSGPRDWWRYALYRRLELRGSRRFASVVVCSDDDRGYLARHGCHNAVTVPNGVDLPPGDDERRRPRAARATDASPRVVFVGNLGYEPNADAVAFFADDVLPRLRARWPSASLDVVGPGAMPGGNERWSSRVRFRGFVDDLGAALGAYDVMVAPIRFGGGTKLKVLDAMAHRIPLVTTPVGAEGLKLLHREHAWIAGSPEGIADGIGRLASDDALADRMTAAAFALVRDRFSWPAIRARMTDWLSRLELPR